MNHLRQRICRKLSPVAVPTVSEVPLSFAVAILTTRAVEYDFGDVRTLRIPLLAFAERIISAECRLSPCDTHDIALLHAPLEPQEAFALLQQGALVSENLFTPLKTPRTQGKNYAASTMDGQQILFPEFETGTWQTKRAGYRKSFAVKGSEGKQVRASGLDVWDLLLPMLQPPLDHNFVDVLDLPPRHKPYHYQWKGIRFLVERTSALLGDDMGTGKTVQSALACRLLFQRGVVRTAIIVTPLSVLSQWDRELELWAPSLRTTVVRGSAEHRKTCWTMPAHVLLTTYDTLRQDSEWLCTSNRASFDLAILDEAQRIKNRSSGMSQAVRSLDCRYKWALTGTPIENRISELASIFAFLKPGVFPGYEVSPNHAKRLIAPYFLRRRKEDVLTDLPAKEEFPVWLRLGEEQQNTYDKMERDGVVALQQQGKTITAQSIVTLIGELRKICNRDPVTGASAKLDWLRENLADVCESGDKVLVFTQYRQAEFGGSDWLQRELSDYGTLNYSEGQTDKHKEQILTAFERDPEKRIFIGHPRTAGLGLNQLVAANYVVHYDHWWNPAVTNQATARAHRPKQTKRVFVYHLWVVDTIEKLILDRTMEKQRLYDDVIDSLSVELSGDVLFDIYDDLLKKHGFRPIERSTPTTGERCVAVDLDPREFELLVGRLFEKLGYATRVTPYSRDGGVDIIAKREVGSSIEKLAIQCKYQSSPVGRPVLQQLLGVVSADPSYTRGVLVTNADVSMETLELVRSNGRLQLVTGPELEQLLSRYDLKKR